MPDFAHLFHHSTGVAYQWLPIVFFGLIVYFLWKTLSLMPRVRPQAISGKMPC